MNIDPSTLIFKMIMNSNHYDVRGGKLPFNGITDVQIVSENNDSFSGDIAKEVMDNFQTRDYISTAYKWKLTTRPEPTFPFSTPEKNTFAFGMCMSVYVYEDSVYPSVRLGPEK